MTVPKKRLGEILVSEGVLDEDQLKSALAEQRSSGGPLGHMLVERGYVDEGSLVLALSRQQGLPTVDLESHEVKEDVRQWLRADLAEQYAVFPVARDRRNKALTLATSDPTNYDVQRELMFHTGMTISLALAGPRAIARAIRRHYYGEALPPLPAAAQPAHATVPSASPAPSNEDLIQWLSRLEKQMVSQKRALRSVLELLESKGHLARNDVLSKLNSKES